MNDLFAADSDTNGSEPLDEGGTWLLDLVSAVDHLRRGYRPGFTVWDALSEALDWATIDVDGDGERVPLLTDVRDDPSHDEIHGAVRTWVLAMGARYNSGYQWPHPTARRAFPPTQVNRVE